MGTFNRHRRVGSRSSDLLPEIRNWISIQPRGRVRGRLRERRQRAEGGGGKEQPERREGRVGQVPPIYSEFDAFDGRVRGDARETGGDRTNARFDTTNERRTVQ